MINLVIFSLISYGMSNILVYGKIFSWLRNILSKWNFTKELMTCMMCMGFWVGILIYFSGYSLINLQYVSIFFQILFYGVLSSGVTWLLHTIQEFIENH